MWGCGFFSLFFLGGGRGGGGGEICDKFLVNMCVLFKAPLTVRKESHFNFGVVLNNG